jgi:hypothetical protein
VPNHPPITCTVPPADTEAVCPLDVSTHRCHRIYYAVIGLTVWLDRKHCLLVRSLYRAPIFHSLVYR